MKFKWSKNRRYGIFQKSNDENIYDAQGHVNYKGRLAQQKTFSEFKEGGGSASFNEVNLKINEDMEMLNELMELYDIDQSKPNHWFSLAYALANEHVPCFSFKARKNKGGRPKKWNDDEKEKLVSHVQKITDEHSSFSAKDACRFLVKNGFYCLSQDGLYTRYMEAKKIKNKK